MGNKLYIGNLTVQASAEDLSSLFAGAGRVISTYVVKDRDTGRAKGFAFIEMSNEAEAAKAIALYNGHALYEQPLIVSEARPSEYRPSAAPTPSPKVKFREVKHKRRGGADRHRFH